MTIDSQLQRPASPERNYANAPSADVESLVVAHAAPMRIHSAATFTSPSKTAMPDDLSTGFDAI